MQPVILLDLDGTLLNSWPRLLRTGFLFLFFVGSIRLKLNPFKMLKTLGKLQTALEDPRCPRTSNQSLCSEILAREMNLTNERARETLLELSRFCFFNLRFLFSRNKDALDFVTWCQEKKLKLILATNPMWPYAITSERIRWAGLSPSDFSWITTAEVMSTCKPMVEYYQELCQKQNLNPASCLMIGNDLRKDGPASKLEMNVVLIKKPAEKVNPLIQVMNFKDIPKFVSQTYV